MFKSLYWNIRSINSGGALERLKQSMNSEKYYIIALAESFQTIDKLEKNRKLLGSQNACSNSNSQLWIFWDFNTNCVIKEEDEQQNSFEVNVQGSILLIIYIYAKCNANMRVDLWDKLRSISANYDLPWMVSGDFNCIVDLAEKKGGTPHRMSKSLISFNA